MPALVLYLAVTIASLAAWRRWVTRFSLGTGVVLVLLPTLFTGPALLTNRAYGGYDIPFLSQPLHDYAADHGFRDAHNWVLVDHATQLAPWQHQVRAAFARGEWPLWNPAMLCGQVLAGNMQSAPYDPLNLIALLLPLDLSTTFGASMTLFLAGLFAFAFARELDCTEGASLIAAAGFALSNAMAFNAGWPLGRAWALFPLLLLAVRRTVHRRDLHAFVLLALAFVLLILTGHPETLLHVVLVGAAYGLFEMAPAWRERVAAIPIAIAAGVLAMLVSAIFILPFLEVLPASAEFHMRQYFGYSPAADSWRIVRATFLPYYGGASWLTRSSEWDFGTARAGSIVLALSCVAAVRLRRQREVAFLLIAALLTFLITTKAMAVEWLLRHLPLLGINRNERLGVVTVLALALLAAKAFDARATLRRERWILLAVGATLAAAYAAFWQRQLDAMVDRRLLIAGVAAELLGLALLAVAFTLTSTRAATALVLAALSAQLLVENGNMDPAVPRSMFYPTVPLLEAIPKDPMHRVVATGNLLLPNIATMYGLDDIRGYEAMTFTPYLETKRVWAPDSTRSYYDVNDLTRPFLNFMGVRYALTPVSTPPPPGWRVVRDDRQTRLLENPHALPRVFVPERIRFVENHVRDVDEMAQAKDFSSVAWLVRENAPPSEIHNAGATIRTQRRGASRYDIDVATGIGSRVVITEAAWPGWRAWIDGRPARIEIANRAFLAVYVPAGSHHLRVEYKPKSFVVGRAISFITIGLLLLLATARLLLRRRV